MTRLIMLAGLLIAAGCSPSPPAVEKSAPEPASPPAATETAKPEEVHPLAGTRWETEGYILEFKDGERVTISGGLVAESFPDGVVGQYTLDEDGNLHIGHADGLTIAGHYSNGELALAGAPEQ